MILRQPSRRLGGNNSSCSRSQGRKFWATRTSPLRERPNRPGQIRRQTSCSRSPRSPSRSPSTLSPSPSQSNGPTAGSSRGPPGGIVSARRAPISRRPGRTAQAPSKPATAEESSHPPSMTVSHQDFVRQPPCQETVRRALSLGAPRKSRGARFDPSGLKATAASDLPWRARQGVALGLPRPPPKVVPGGVPTRGLTSSSRRVGTQVKMSQSELVADHRGLRPS